MIDQTLPKLLAGNVCDVWEGRSGSGGDGDGIEPDQVTSGQDSSGYGLPSRAVTLLLEVGGPQSRIGAAFPV